MWSNFKNFLFGDKSKELNEISKMDLHTVLAKVRQSPDFKNKFDKYSYLVQEIEARFDNYGEDRVVVHYNKEYYPFTLVPVKQDDEKLRIIKRDGEFKSSYFYLAGSNGLEQFLHSLRKSLNVPIKSAHFIDPDRSIRDLCNFPDIYHIEKIIINKPSVTKDELDFISTHFQKIKSMCFHTNPPEGMEDFPLKYESACISNDVKLKVDQLVNMRCVYLDILKTKNLLVSDIEMFLNYWKSTNLPRNLRKLLIQNVNPEHHKGKMILNVFPFKFHPKNRSRFFPNFPIGLIDARRGEDIRSEDGTIGSLLYYTENSLTFIIWRERFPKIPKIYMEIVSYLEGKTSDEEEHQMNNTKEDAPLCCSSGGSPVKAANLWAHRFYNPEE